MRCGNHGPDAFAVTDVQDKQRRRRWLDLPARSYELWPKAARPGTHNHGTGRQRSQAFDCVRVVPKPVVLVRPQTHRLRCRCRDSVSNESGQDRYDAQVVSGTSAARDGKGANRVQTTRRAPSTSAITQSTPGSKRRCSRDPKRQGECLSTRRSVSRWPLGLGALLSPCLVLCPMSHDRFPRVERNRPVEQRCSEPPTWCGWRQACLVRRSERPLEWPRVLWLPRLW